MLTLKGKTALVSGGGGGLGLEIVKEFLENGMNAVICSSRKEKGEQAREKLPEYLQERCIAVGCNVSDPDAVRAALKAAEEKFGGVDVIINGAGMHDKAKFDIPMEKWELCLSSNVTGTFVMMREAIPYLEKSASPRIINISTVDGRTGGYEGGIAAAAAKGGIISVTRAAARELAGKGITVNCVAVGSLEGDIDERRTPEGETAILSKIPLGRFGEPRDIAPAVCFLASEESRYITGAVLDINGGLFMC